MRPSENSVWRPWSEIQVWNWRRSEEAVLNPTWEVREGLPRRWHLSWVLRDKDKWAVRIRSWSSFMLSKSGMYILHPTWLLTWGISSILNCGEIHFHVSIHPHICVFYFLIWGLPSCLSTRTLGSDEGSPAKLAHRKLYDSNLRLSQFQQRKSSQLNPPWVWIFAGRFRFR